jgi:hypothetical protein
MCAAGASNATPTLAPLVPHGASEVQNQKSLGQQEIKLAKTNKNEENREKTKPGQFAHFFPRLAWRATGLKSYE